MYSFKSSFSRYNTGNSDFGTYPSPDYFKTNAYADVSTTRNVPPSYSEDHHGYRNYGRSYSLDSTRSITLPRIRSLGKDDLRRTAASEVKRGNKRHETSSSHNRRSSSTSEPGMHHNTLESISSDGRRCSNCVNTKLWIMLTLALAILLLISIAVIITLAIQYKNCPSRKYRSRTSTRIASTTGSTTNNKKTTKAQEQFSNMLDAIVNVQQGIKPMWFNPQAKITD